jgi:2-methylcitrate dehydratase PrpD
MMNLHPSDSQKNTTPVAGILANFVSGLEFGNLDQNIICQATLVARDTLGTMLAGSTLPEIRKLANWAAGTGGVGNATLMSRETTVPAHLAAMVNATGAVSLELDEGNQYAVNHPAVHIFPAALAIAEEYNRSGAELVTALVAGYEVAVQVGLATHLRDPVHPFGTHATIGTAATAARLLNLSENQIAEALELAAGLCIASSQTAANTGASVRNLATGFTNHNGLLAPLMVKAGFTGEPGALSIVFGQILGDSFDSAAIGNDLGKLFYITRNYFKMHACSRWNHAPIEAIAALCKNASFSINEVESITVWTYDPATRLSWNNPPNGYAAKHSIPYNVAVRLVKGTNGLESYSNETVADINIQRIVNRIQVKEDPAYTAMLPDVRPARVEVILADGRKIEEVVDRPAGGFDNPFPEEQLADKFRRLAGMATAESKLTQLTQTIDRLPELKDLSELSFLLRTRR